MFALNSTFDPYVIFELSYHLYPTYHAVFPFLPVLSVSQSVKHPSAINIAPLSFYSATLMPYACHLHSFNCLLVFTSITFMSLYASFLHWFDSLLPYFHYGSFIDLFRPSPLVVVLLLSSRWSAIRWIPQEAPALSQTCSTRSSASLNSLSMTTIHRSKCNFSFIIWCILELI